MLDLESIILLFLIALFFGAFFVILVLQLKIAAMQIDCILDFIQEYTNRLDERITSHLSSMFCIFDTKKIY